MKKTVKISVLYPNGNGASEGETDAHPGYSKNDQQQKQTSNRRNGYGARTVRTEQGDITVEVSRDRKLAFPPASSGRAGDPAAARPLRRRLRRAEAGTANSRSILMPVPSIQGSHRCR